MHWLADPRPIQERAEAQVEGPAGGHPKEGAALALARFTVLYWLAIDVYGWELSLGGRALHSSSVQLRAACTLHAEN